MKQVTSDDVAEVWNVVNVGQGAGDEDVPASWNRELCGLLIRGRHGALRSGARFGPSKLQPQGTLTRID